MRKMRTLLAVTLATLALASCGGTEVEPTPTPAPTATPTPITVRGIVTLHDGKIAERAGIQPGINGECGGQGAHEDINAGMPVLLLADGATLDLARLEAGKYSSVKEAGYTPAGASARTHIYYTTECELGFTLTVPPGHSFYQVRLGTRGEFDYTASELTTPGRLHYDVGR